MFDKDNKFGFINNNNNDSNNIKNTDLPYTISSKVLTTVPASNVKLEDEITINNASINKDRRYYIEFLDSKKLCNLLTSEELGGAIICSIGNYNIQAVNDSTDLVIYITKLSQSNESAEVSFNYDQIATYDLNPEDEIIPNATDLVIYEEEIKCLDSKYLENDLVLQNSISLGRVGKIGTCSSAIGYNVEASGYCSHAEGIDVKASGSYGSHAEGDGTTASGESSHSEGTNTIASGESSHSEGDGTEASGENSHAEGNYTVASGENSHAEGENTHATGGTSHAEGKDTIASEYGSHAEGNTTTASGMYSHAEGNSTTASGGSSHAEGNSTTASGTSSHAEGYNTKASSDYQHVQGRYNVEDVRGKYSHIVGNGTDDKKRSNAHTLDWQGNAWYSGEVKGTNLPYTVSSKVLTTVTASNVKIGNPITVNNVSINKDRKYYIEFLGSKKLCNLVISENSASEISCTISNYEIQGIIYSSNLMLSVHKMSADDTTTDTFTNLVIYEEEIKCLDNKYLENDLRIQNSISLGRMGKVGACSGAIGMTLEASGMASHAEGYGAMATGNFSHAEGSFTEALNESSHAEGYSTKASSENQHVQGKYNIEDAEGKYAHIVGNGVDEDNRSNAHTLDWKGNGWYAGKLSQEGTPTENKDLTTKKYVDDKVSSLPQFSFNENGELVVTINGVSKTFVPKSE